MLKKLPRKELCEKLMKEVIEDDLKVIEIKDKEYGSSWKKRGGQGAFMMLARKFDRMETQINKIICKHKEVPGGNYLHNFITFDDRDEGILDDVQDLRRYFILICDECGYDMELSIPFDFPISVNLFWDAYKKSFKELENNVEKLKYDIFDPSLKNIIIANWKFLTFVDVARALDKNS